MFLYLLHLKYLTQHYLNSLLESEATKTGELLLMGEESVLAPKQAKCYSFQQETELKESSLQGQTFELLMIEC